MKFLQPALAIMPQFARIRLRSVVGILLGAVIVAQATAARAASPRDELLRLVPEDVGFCLVIQDLRGQLDSFLNSRFYERFRSSPLYRTLRHGPDADQFVAAQKQLLEALHTSWPELRDEIFGDAVVISYRPALGKDKKPEQGLILVRARKADLLRELVNRLNDVQANEIKIDKRSHAGAEYFQRDDARGTHFVYVRGSLLALSPNEDALEQLIDRDQAAAGAGVPPLVQQLEKLGAAEALATLWINPRIFEAEMERHAEHARGSDAILHRAIMTYWKALEGIALSFSLEPQGAELRLTFRTEPKRLPEPARQFLTAETKPSELWSRFPENAILTVAGRMNTGEWNSFLGTFMDPKSRGDLRDQLNRKASAALGDNVVDDILPFLGPDWGFCIAAPPGGRPEWFPHMAWALRVQRGKTNPPVDQSLVNMLKAFAGIMVFAYNMNHAGDDELALRSLKRDGAEINYLKNDKQFPPGFQPAFGLKDGYLIIASSPQAIDALGRAGATTKAMPAGVPLLRLSVVQLSRFLEERKDILADHIAEKHRITKEEASRHLNFVREALALFESVEFSQQPSVDRISLALRVRTADPLKR
jgi:hypothetical protein